MSFAEIQFPADIAYGSAGGPEFSTDIVVTHGGHEQRNSNWAESRARYNVAAGIRTQAQLEALIAFFRARRGQAEGFRFKDWTDYRATGEIIATGNGVLKDFQLIKTYSSGDSSHVRAITKPVAGSVTVYLNAVPQSSGVTVDSETGMISFATAPGGSVVIQADFEFDVPVRFATDRLSARLETYGAYSALDIPLVEVRVGV